MNLKLHNAMNAALVSLLFIGGIGDLLVGEPRVMLQTLIAAMLLNLPAHDGWCRGCRR